MRSYSYLKRILDSAYEDKASVFFLHVLYYHSLVLTRLNFS